jgi:hypothetical protein
MGRAQIAHVLMKGIGSTCRMAKEGGINIGAMPLEQLNMMREQLQVRGTRFQKVPYVCDT